MQDLPRSPNELMPEVTALIPYFIENLGNSKVSFANSTWFPYLVRPFIIHVTKIVWATIFTLLCQLFLLHVSKSDCFHSPILVSSNQSPFNLQLIIN